MSKDRSNSTFKFLPLLSIVVCVLMLEAIHFFNGFPLLLPDSKKYIQHAVNVIETSHWSNTYIYFLAKNFQFLNSIQWVPIFQNLLISSTLYFFISNVFPKRSLTKLNLILFLLCFTSLPWISNVIMSDISTPVSLLILIIFFTYKLKWWTYILLSFFFLFAASSHQSHIAIIPIFSFVLICGNLLFRSHNDKLHLFKISLMILGLMVVSFQFEKNILNSKETKIQKEKNGKSKSDITTGYYFVVVRMWEVGEIDKLLSVYCPDNMDNYLCNPNNSFPIKAKLPPAKKRNEGNETYQRVSRDHKHFILGCLSNPRFYYALFKVALKRSPTLLKQTGIRPNYPVEGTSVTRNIQRISKDNKRRYLKSKQIKGFFKEGFMQWYTLLDRIWWFFLLPFTVLFFIIEARLANSLKIISKEKWMILISLFLGHLINTIICGTFSNHENVRYSSRTIWLVNLAVILLFIFVYQNRSNRKSLVE